MAVRRRKARGLAIPVDELAAALRALLRMTTGFYGGFAGMLEVGQLENLRHWVESKNHTGRVPWYKDDLSRDQAIGHFLRIRRERELGYDIEIDLNPELGHIGPRGNPDVESDEATSRDRRRGGPFGAIPRLPLPPFLRLAPRGAAPVRMNLV